MQVDNATSKNNSGVNSTTLTISFANAGNAIVVAIPESRVATVNSVTYNGVSFGSALASTSNGNSRCWLYGLMNPAIGTHDVVVTYSTSQTGYIAGVISFLGAYGFGNTNTKTGTAQNKSITLDTTYYGSYVVDVIGALGGVHTKDASATALVSNNNRIASYKGIGAAGTGAGNMAWTATASDVYSYAAVEIKSEFRGRYHYQQQQAAV